MGQTGFNSCFFCELLDFTLIFSTCMSDGAKEMVLHRRLIYW